MAAEPISTTIRILDKEYSVRCPPDEEDALQESARYLSGKMAEARSSGRSLSQDRVTVMTALNITFEYLKLRREKETLEAELTDDIHRIASKLASSFARRAPSSPVD